MGCGASQEGPPPKKLYSFRVRLIGGLNLFNNGFGMQVPGTKTSTFNFNGKSDPYCVLECSGVRHQSETVLHEQNPVWNQDFIFAVDTKKPIIKLSVFDADLVSKDDCLGTVEVNLHGLLEQKEREIWVPLKGAKANGEIGFSVIECYRMFVTAKSGKDVKPMDSLSGSSDCYLTLQVGQQARMKTLIKGWTLNPVWNQKFMFYVPYGVESQLEMILWDHDTVGTDNNMGWCYHKFDGKPKAAPQEHESKIYNAQGTLSYTIEDQTGVECPDAGPVTEDQKKKFPPTAPQTCTFQCRVVGAYNLAASDTNYVADFFNKAAAEHYHEYKESAGTSDPFARVKCEGQVHDTPHINNTLEPTWNHKMRFVCRSKEESKLLVELHDHDVLANDCLGAVTLPLNMMKPGERTELWSFLDKGRGEVGLELEMDFQLKVRVVACSDLPAKDMNGMCDPYVKLTLGGKGYQTRVVRNNRAPWIEEDFRWAVPTLKDIKLHVEVWDKDLMIFKKGLSEDLIGACDVPLDGLPHGIPNDMTVPLMVSGKPQGSIRLVITDEIPLPQSALSLLAEKGKEAFNEAVASLTKTADIIKTLKLPDFDKKEEAVVEPFDEKIAPRPRFARINVKVLGARGLKNCTAPMYVGVAVPLQGQRYKTKEYSEAVNPDIQESFEFRVPTKTTSALEFTVFESNKHAYTGMWPQQHHSKVSKYIASLNDDVGLIKGSPANDTVLELEKGGKLIVNVSEMYRFNLRVKGGSDLKTKSDPYVVLETGSSIYRTHTVPKDPAKDRTEGIPGKPIWNEQFTFFSKEKGIVTFKLMDEDTLSDSHLGTGKFDLNELRRGVPAEVTVRLDKGGEITIWAKEEEKMALMDQVIDAAANAAKFAMGAVGEAADAAANAAGAVAGKIGGALGGFFGK